MPQRLHGIIQCLTTLGYGIEIIPTIHLNRFSVDIFERTIFLCSITNLPFNVECTDAVCKILISAVQFASNNIFHADNIPTYTQKNRGMKAVQEIRNSRRVVDFLHPGIKLWYEIPKPLDLDEEFTRYSFPYLHLA
ncbi:hypothetical protein FQR65_LT06590 [Abscondita terminalis]|nr:hypothetical protein FQR65_LT06590 [Abscondita terminalis]